MKPEHLAQIEALIKGVEFHALREGAKKITHIRIRIGASSGLNEETFRKVFKKLSHGTVLEQAEVSTSQFISGRIDVVSFDCE
jgi:Zn finger protein HypA/HybF involved in hydrogenase expression